VPLLVGSYDGMAYRSLPGRLVRYVIVKDPGGVYRTETILSTDCTMSPLEIVEAYARRWPLERTFQECKQKLGLQDHQTQLPASVRRCAPFTMFLYSLVVLWYLLHGHQLASELPTEKDPWYPKTGRPSFTDMLACLRRVGWTERFLEPTQQAKSRAEAFAAYLARVVATA